MIDGRYFLWLPPATARAPLVVEGNRLVRHIYRSRNGQETEREVFWATPEGRLAFADYRAQPSDTSVQWQGLPVANFTKATGSAAQLAAELHGRFAESTFQKQVKMLMKAVADWAVQHGGVFPPREALLPDGAFWRWKGAPHLRNAVTGGPMVLGSGAGNFDYMGGGNIGGSYDYSISVHRGYGLPDYAESEGGS